MDSGLIGCDGYESMCLRLLLMECHKMCSGLVGCDGYEPMCVMMPPKVFHRKGDDDGCRILTCYQQNRPCCHALPHMVPLRRDVEKSWMRKDYDDVPLVDL